MTARRPSSIAILALALAVASGCGRYAVRGSKGPTTTTPRDVAVGSGVHPSETTSTAAGSSEDAQSKTPPPTAARSATSPNSNRVTNTDSGLRFVFTVGSKTAFGAKEDFPLEVTITNVSGQALTYEPNQPRNFILGHASGETGATWFDTDCDPANSAGQSPSLQLAPGAELHLSALYPGPPEAKNRESCRRPVGDYVAGALFALCDRVKSDQSCDTGALHYAKSLGVRISIG